VLKNIKIANIVSGVIIFLLIIFAIYFSLFKKPNGGGDVKTSTSTPSVSTKPVQYKNNQYGFVFSLPDSWKGYTIVNDEWDGYSLSGDISQQVVTETGPLIFIRHPSWTEDVQRQDVPIMVFTIDQWTKLQKEEFHIGAAPVGPSEVGRNSKYVFAIPARYNFSFLKGFEEVEEILQNKPLKTF